MSTTLLSLIQTPNRYTLLLSTLSLSSHPFGFSSLWPVCVSPIFISHSLYNLAVPHNRRAARIDGYVQRSTHLSPCCLPNAWAMSGRLVTRPPWLACPPPGVLVDSSSRRTFGTPIGDAVTKEEEQWAGSQAHKNPIKIRFLERTSKTHVKHRQHNAISVIGLWEI